MELKSVPTNAVWAHSRARPGSPCPWPLVLGPLVCGPSSGAAVPLRWRYRAAATESAQCTSRSCLFPALDGECSVERGHVTPSRCATPAPCREATRRQNPTGPRREQLWASGEPQKLPDRHSLLLHSSGEPGDRDPEEAAVWGGRPVGKEIGEGTLREPREHSATRGVGSEGSGDKSEQGGAGDRVGARGLCADHLPLLCPAEEGSVRGWISFPHIPMLKL